MPSASPRTIISAIETAFRSSSATAKLTSTPVGHPRTFYISAPGGPFHLWVYIWTLTPGGRVQLPNEYRIQMTSVRSPLPRNPAGPTLLLGYHIDSGYFAGFDLARHQFFTEGSPSVQISINTLQEASQSGLAFALKDNDEIAIGIRPDRLLDYALFAPRLHAQGIDEATKPLLLDAVSTIPPDEDRLSALPEDRQRVIREISTLSRDGRFRKSVLNAYGHRCAVTGMMLNLLDAAHILPVSAPGSTDETTNGIALSPTVHRAFDNGLIYVDSDYMLRVNETQLGSLRDSGRDQGWDTLRHSLREAIWLPEDVSLYPSREKIEEANRFRGIVY